MLSHATDKFAIARRRFLTIASVAAAMFTVPSVAGAAEIHVAPGGSGDGTAGSPLGSVQAAFDAAASGDTVIVQPGTYSEALETSGDGPITVSGSGAVIEASGRALDIQHPDWRFEGLVVDGLFGDRDAVRVGADGHRLALVGVEVRNSGRDCIDMAGSDDVLIEDALIHHCLNWDGGRVDAHGITGGPVQRLTIRRTEIHTFTGDAVQFDPGRSSPGWNDITIEESFFWLEPLPAAIAGVPAGTVPGENAIDTKTDDAAPRANLTIRDLTCRGFGGGLISNQAAILLKENVRATIDGITISDSELAFRLRGSTSSRPNGAIVTIHNAVVHDVDTVIRYEDGIQEPIELDHATIGNNVGRLFQDVGAPAGSLVVRNLLVLDAALPGEASGSGNLVATSGDFVDAANHDYRLAADSAAIDVGESLAVTHDRIGTARPQGAGHDAGAYEYTDNPVPPLDSGGPPDAATGSDMGAADGSSAADGAAGSDASVPDQSVGDGPPPQVTDGLIDPDRGESGCGCTVSREERPNAWGLILLLGLLAWRRRNATEYAS